MQAHPNPQQRNRMVVTDGYEVRGYVAASNKRPLMIRHIIQVATLCEALEEYKTLANRLSQRIGGWHVELCHRYQIDGPILSISSHQLTLGHA